MVRCKRLAGSARIIWLAASVVFGVATIARIMSAGGLGDKSLDLDFSLVNI
jgi:hypothetical protein